MNKSLEELEQIVEGAPEEAGNYHSGFKKYYGGTNVRNLDDLRRTIKLEEENQRLRDQIKEMSELCLTTGEVNKIKADAIRGALKHLDNKQRFSNTFLTGRQVLEDYAKKLEGE